MVLVTAARGLIYFPRFQVFMPGIACVVLTRFHASPALIFCVIVGGENMKTWKVGYTVGVADNALRASSSAFDPGVHDHGCLATCSLPKVG